MELLAFTIGRHQNVWLVRSWSWVKSMLDSAVISNVIEKKLPTTKYQLNRAMLVSSMRCFDADRRTSVNVVVYCAFNQC